MSKNDNYVVVLDIGSSKIRTVVAQLIPDGKPRVIGVGVSDSAGLRKGTVVDIEDVSVQIKESVNGAELNSGVKIESVYVSIGGSNIFCKKTKGVIAVGRADSEVVQEDVNRVIEASSAVNILQNQEILHVMPQNFKLDDQGDIKDPIGMTGVRLEMNGILITGSTPQIKNISKCVANSGLDVDGFVISPLAAAKAVLNKRQKELGVVLIDMGGGTTSLSVYEEGQLLHVAVLPVGSGHITNDIAIGLRTSVDVAEKVKLRYASASSSDISKKDQIDLSSINSDEEGIVSRKHVSEIAEARVEEIFYMIEKELKKINRSALLPAGAVITGGGACMPGIVDLAKDILALPAQTAFPVELSGLVDKVDNPSFAVSVGMILWSLEDEQFSEKGTFTSSESHPSFTFIKGYFEIVRKWFNKFLP